LLYLFLLNGFSADSANYKGIALCLFFCKIVWLHSVGKT